jgi:hypothetical protein
MSEAILIFFIIHPGHVKVLITQISLTAKENVRALHYHVTDCAQWWTQDYAAKGNPRFL